MICTQLSNAFGQRLSSLTMSAVSDSYSLLLVRPVFLMKASLPSEAVMDLGDSVLRNGARLVVCLGKENTDTSILFLKNLLYI